MILLLGAIIAGVDSVALFGIGDRSIARKLGQEIDGFYVGSIEPKGVILYHESKAYILRAGDELDIGSAAVTITTGIERRGDTIVITESLREYILKDGLISILNQAASEPVYDEEGKQIGYRLFEIDGGSAYEIAGLRDNDVILDINGVDLTTPFVAMKSMLSVRNMDRFSFRYMRYGMVNTATIEIH